MNTFKCLPLIVAICSLGTANSFADKVSPDEAQIRAHYDAVVNGNRQRSASLSLEGYAREVLVFDIVPPLSVNYDTAVKSYETFFAEVEGPVTSDFSHIRIKMLGPKSALVTSFFHQDFTMKTGTKMSMRVRVTDVFEKQGGKWLIIHEHNSVPINMQTGKGDFSAPEDGDPAYFTQP